MRNKEFPGFIFWDGEECKDAGYCLFGCSVYGQPPDSLTYVQVPFLRTRQMLDLILDVGARFPGAAHVWFSADYDVNWILRELSWPELITLAVKGKVEWDGYTIEHIPGKIFKVAKDGIRVRIDDCFSFFRQRYDKALYKYDISTGDIRQKISAGKDNRSEFYWTDIDEIREYWGLELVTGCALMTKIRLMCLGAGFAGMNKWYGPGALAAYSLKQNKVTEYMAESPPKVKAAALRAYAGGWFERFQCGLYNGPVWTADINSAYVYAMSLLPNLAKGHWEYTRTNLVDRARSCKFGIFRCKWQVDFNGYLRACQGIPFPLFHRDRDGTIKRPFASDVWLWNPEAANASTTPFATLTEGWIFIEDDPDDYPFNWVATMFDTRLAMQAAGDPSEKILKWALASYYGRVAQRKGWNKKSNAPPMFHQIEWAGWITSKCRAMIYRAAIDVAARGGLVSVDTDGIISTVPFIDLQNGEGNQLGRWKVEEYTDMIYIQNGVYWLGKGGGYDAKLGYTVWEDPKLRGIPRTRLSPDIALEALSGDGRIHLSRHGFRGYRAALHGHREQWRMWVDDDLTVSVLSAGARTHNRKTCRACARGIGLNEGLHDLALTVNRDRVSRPHRLPWIDGEDLDAKLQAMLAKEILYPE
jgi:hypothetical protein